MQRFVLTVLFFFLAGSAFGQGGFELQDPATDFFKEKDRTEATPMTARPPQREGMHCTLDTDTGECFCIGKESAQLLQMTPQECGAQVRLALEKLASQP